MYKVAWAPAYEIISRRLGIYTVYVDNKAYDIVYRHSKDVTRCS